MSRFATLTGTAVIVLLAGCGTARYVQRTQTGGTLALEGERQKAMEEAAKIMADHCRGPYTIVSEGEAVIGSETQHRDDTFVTKDGKVVNKGAEVTRQSTEWRVTYECGGAPPAGLRASAHRRLCRSEPAAPTPSRAVDSWYKKGGSPTHGRAHQDSAAAHQQRL